MRVTGSIVIDESEIEERFIRASGPGGQHVNKTASAVQLRFDALASPNLPDDLKARLRRIAGSRMTKDGEIVITADNHRSQERNRADARERLIALLVRAAEKPKPRRKTRPSLASVRRNKAAKEKRGTVKKLRGRPGMEE
jgi:ribosome-associated protein